MKSSPLALLTLALGLAIGFGVGAVWNGSEGVAAAPQTLTQDGGGRAASSLQPNTDDAGFARVSDVDSTGVQTASVARTKRAPGPGARAAARKAIALARSLGADEDETAWTHTIRGAVLDVDGDPMPGVQVVCMNRKSNGWRGLLSGRDSQELGRAWDGLPEVEAELAEQATRLQEDRRHASTAITDATGGFTLEGLREGVHQVTAYADGYEFAPQMTHTGRDCTLIGEAVLEMELDVRLPDGTQPTEAVIFPGETNFGSELAWSPLAPRVRLNEAAFELVVRHGNVRRIDWRTRSSDYESEPRLMNLELEGAGPHVIELRANQILRVRVDDTSELLPKIPVWVKATPVTDDPGAIEWSDTSRTVLAVAPSGDFEVSGMPSGKFLVAAGRGEGNDPDVVQEVTIGEGVTEAILSVGEPRMDSFLVVHCGRADGTPVDKVEFEAQPASQEFRGLNRVTPQRRARGEYWIARGQLFHKSDDGSKGPVRLVAATETDGELSVEVERDQDSVSIEFQPSCSVEVQVRGDLSAGYSIKATLLDGGESLQRYSFLAMKRGAQKVKEDGHVVLQSLQPGEYEIGVYQTGHEASNGFFLGNARRAVTAKVEVNRMGQELELVIPTSHTVMVHAEGLEAGTTLQLFPKGGSRYRDGSTADVGPDAMARFDDVLAGEYILQVKSGTDAITVTVPTGEVQFSPKVVYALKVRSVDAGSPAEAAGFLKDDLITAIGGKPVTGWMEFTKLRTSAASTSVGVTVTRGQQAVSLVIGPVGEENGKPKSLGLRTSPQSR